MIRKLIAEIRLMLAIGLVSWAAGVLDLAHPDSLRFCRALATALKEPTRRGPTDE